MLPLRTPQGSAFHFVQQLIGLNLIARQLVRGWRPWSGHSVFSKITVLQSPRMAGLLLSLEWKIVSLTLKTMWGIWGNHTKTEAAWRQKHRLQRRKGTVFLTFERWNEQHTWGVQGWLSSRLNRTLNRDPPYSVSLPHWMNYGLLIIKLWLQPSRARHRQPPSGCLGSRSKIEVPPMARAWQNSQQAVAEQASQTLQITDCRARPQRGGVTAN